MKKSNAEAPTYVWRPCPDLYLTSRGGPPHTPGHSSGCREALVKMIYKNHGRLDTAIENFAISASTARILLLAHDFCYGNCCPQRLYASTQFLDDRVCIFDRRPQAYANHCPVSCVVLVGLR